MDVFPISDLSVKRKIEKHREKVLRTDSLLRRNPYVQPVPSSTKRKSNKKRKKSQMPKKPDEDSPKVSNLNEPIKEMVDLIVRVMSGRN